MKAPRTIAIILALVALSGCTASHADHSSPLQKLSRFLVESSPSDGSIVSAVLCVPVEKAPSIFVGVAYKRRTITLLQIPVALVQTEGAWLRQDLIVAPQSFDEDGEILLNVTLNDEDGRPLSREAYSLSDLVEEFQSRSEVTQGEGCDRAKHSSTGTVDVAPLHLNIRI